MRLKATLLAIVAVLSLGFTSCTDELGSDQTQGKPGYLTINVKTLKPTQSKFIGTGATDDFTKIQDYQSAITQAKNMLEKSIISKDDIVLIEDKLAEKYGLKFGSIYREIDLINIAIRAKMV